MTMITASASIRGIWTEAEASHEYDEQGAYTFVELIYATGEGEPLADVIVDGHIDQGQLHRILSDLSRGVTSPGAQVSWVSATGAVA